jgi:hypothetical protein
MKTKFTPTLTLAVALPLLLSGCATSAVWSGADQSVSFAPAPNPDLALFDAPGRCDVLVQYNALKPRNQRIERHAYFLRPNRERIAAGKKPQFVSPKVATGLMPIPMFASPVGAQDASVYGVAGDDGQQFTIYRGGTAPENCRLPVYADHSDLGMRVALTPFAVAADATVLGAWLIGQGGWAAAP